MDLELSPTEQAFAQEVRAFIAARLPKDIEAKVRLDRHLGREDYMRWQRILGERGWFTGAWPDAHGGHAWTAVQSHLFNTIAGEMNCPELQVFGPSMVGPVIQAFGTPAQRAEHLPKIRTSELWWCQGYSEPGAGSDLAALRTRAVRQGDQYVVNGQKVWNTHGQYADWIFCLVRTGTQGRPQESISFLLIDLRSPGVEIRPIITFDGAHEINEVWFTDVKVPVENLVGEENRGWTYAKFLLAHERANFGTMMGWCRRDLARLRRIAEQEQSGQRRLIDDPLFGARLARLEAELLTIETVNMRLLSAGNVTDAHSASFLKIVSSELQQAIADLSLLAGGPGSLVFDRKVLGQGEVSGDARATWCAPLAATYLNMRKTSIYGGSNEIQKNITAKLLLDAPPARETDFGLSSEQEMLRDMLERYLRDVKTAPRLPDQIDPKDEAALWAGLVEIGVTGMLTPEQAEMLGGGVTETMLVLRELGRAGATTPFISQAVLATLALRSSTQAMAQEWLSRMHAPVGGVRVALAFDDAASRYDWHAPRAAARISGESVFIEGAKTAVDGAPSADALVVSAALGDGDVAVFLVPRDACVVTRSYRGLDGTSLGDVSFSGAATRALLLARGEAANDLIEELRGWHIASLAALGVGAMESVCAMTARYLSERKQFGQTLSQFQVLRHRFIDMRIQLLKAQAMAEFAANWAVCRDCEERRKALASAKLTLSEAAAFVAEQAVQLHGAIGMTSEYELGTYFRMLTTVRLLGGDVDTQLAMLRAEPRH